MDDVVLAQTLRAGGAPALAHVLDRYERELFDYAVTLLGDPGPAAAAVHDALLTAAGTAARLANPRLFRPWLYALVRSECQRRASGLAGAPEPGAGAHEAPAGILAGDPGGRTTALREVSDLVHRQLMNDAEVARVLGTSERRARRLRAAADTGLAEAGGAFVPFRASPHGTVPPGLREGVLTAAADRAQLAARAAAAGVPRRSGFPHPVHHAPGHRVRRTGRALALVAASLVLLALVVLAVISAPIGRIHLSGGSAASPTPSASLGGGAEGSASPSRSPAPSPTAASEPTPAPEPSRAPAPRPSPAPSVQPARGGPITGPGHTCLEVSFGRTADGSIVGVFTCNGTPAQRWSGGARQSLRAAGKCLDFETPQRGTPVQRAVLWPCDGTPSQRWTARGGLLVNSANGECLELPPGRTANLTAARIGPCSGAANQQWRLDP